MARADAGAGDGTADRSAARRRALRVGRLHGRALPPRRERERDRAVPRSRARRGVLREPAVLPRERWSGGAGAPDRAAGAGA